MVPGMCTAIGANCYSAAAREKEKAAMKAQRDRVLLRWRLINFLCLHQANTRIKLFMFVCLLIAVLALTMNTANLMGWQSSVSSPLCRFG